MELLAGLANKINHSCDPTCGIRVVETDGRDLVAIKDMFVARRDIDINEEITYDYAMRNYDIDHFQNQCRCGAERCRGRITGWKDLPDEWKNKYDGLVALYLLELDDRYSAR